MARTKHPGQAGRIVWHTAFMLSPEGAAKLDETAGRLSKQRPPGLIAVVMTGKMKSVLRITTHTIGREARITGAASEEDARDLSLILMSGSLEAELGSDLKGTSGRGEVESFTYYGTREAVAPQLQKLR